MKSKARPSARITTSRTSSPLSVSSGILQGDVAEDSGHGLGLIGRVLEELVQITPAHRLDQHRDFSDTVVESGNRPREQVIAFVLEPMNLLRRALELRGL